MVDQSERHAGCACFFLQDEIAATRMVEWMRVTAPLSFGPFYRAAELVSSSEKTGWGARIEFEWPSMGREHDTHLFEMVYRRAIDLYRSSSGSREHG